MFLVNNEKHFRMQFVIELVSSLVGLLRQALLQRLPSGTTTLDTERAEMQLEDVRAQLLREDMRLKTLLVESHKTLKLQKLQL